jgi:hypothetical protein
MFDSASINQFYEGEPQRPEPRYRRQPPITVIVNFVKTANRLQPRIIQHPTLPNPSPTLLKPD